MSENPYGQRPANLSPQAAAFYDRHETPKSADLARLADSVRGQK